MTELAGSSDAAPVPAPRRNRRHGLALAAICLVGLLRGLFWVAATDVWNPVDEAHHYGFIASLGEGHGIPKVGVDQVPIEVLEIEKASPTLWQRGSPHPADLADPWWSTEASQYEGVQPPLYYLVITPAYWVSRPFGAVTALYALRAATVLLSLLAVPLTWLLARELLPRWPTVWLAAPAVLVAINGFNSNLASITNDALVAPLAAATMVAVVRFVRTPTKWWAAVAGGLVGLAFLNKTTSAGLLGLMGLAVLWLLVRRKISVPMALGSAVIAGAAAALVVSPWILFNLATYGSPTAASATSEITGGVMTTDVLSLQTLKDHWTIVLGSFWDFQLRDQRDATYATLFGWTAVAAFVAGVVALFRRRDRDGAAGLTWAAAAFPLAYLGMEAIVFGVFGGSGQAVGRHLYMALPALAVVIAGGLIVTLGARWGPVAVAGLIALALIVEQPKVRHFSTYAYTYGLLEPDLAPVVDQSLSEGIVPTSGIRVDPPCPVHVMALAVSGEPPPTLPLTSSGGTNQARHTGNQTTDFDSVFNGSQGQLAVYVLDRPETAAFEVRPPEPVALGAAAADVEPRVGLLDGPGDPVALLYCPVADPEGFRFEQLYGPLHPGPVTYGFLQEWPRAWALAGVAGFLVLLVRAARRRPPDPHRPDH